MQVFFFFSYKENTFTAKSARFLYSKKDSAKAREILQTFKHCQARIWHSKEMCKFSILCCLVFSPDSAASDCEGVGAAGEGTAATLAAVAARASCENSAEKGRSKGFCSRAWQQLHIHYAALHNYKHYKGIGWHLLYPYLNKWWNELHGWYLFKIHVDKYNLFIMIIKFTFPHNV